MKPEETRIAVIAPGDEALPFLATGSAVFFAETASEAREKLKQSVSQGFPVILISDDFLKKCSDIIQEYSHLPSPAITALPGKSGTATFAMKRLNEEVKKAIGIDIEGLGVK